MSRIWRQKTKGKLWKSDFLMRKRARLGYKVYDPLNRQDITDSPRHTPSETGRVLYDAAPQHTKGLFFMIRIHECIIRKVFRLPLWIFEVRVTTSAIHSPLSRNR